MSEIWFYPVKSLGGIALTSATILEKGIRHDRRWMLVDAHGRFMTQRSLPQLALFKPSINDSTMTITNTSQENNPDTVSFPLQAAAGGKIFRAEIWNDHVDVVEVNQDISKWFSARLAIPCRLVSFPESNIRLAKKGGKNVSLADAYPYLVIGQRSLDELNGRLATPLPMNRFRPNFVFTGGDPFDEDSWTSFSIGSVSFRAIGPCARCTVPTIDQKTAIKGTEPLATLSGYRKSEGKVLFGQNLVALDSGVVTVGDRITPITEEPDRL